MPTKTKSRKKASDPAQAILPGIELQAPAAKAQSITMTVNGTTITISQNGETPKAASGNQLLFPAANISTEPTPNSVIASNLTKALAEARSLSPEEMRNAIRNAVYQNDAPVVEIMHGMMGVLYRDHHIAQGWRKRQKTQKA